MTARAVTFDFWNTICRADVAATVERRRAAWCDVVLDRALPIEPEVVDAVLVHVAERHHAGWMRNAQFTADHALDEACALFGDAVTADDRRALADAWVHASRRADVGLTPRAAEVLAALDHAGVRVGIVCDVGLTPSSVLREYLTALGVLRHFDHLSFSDEVGVYKPHPAIFRHALEGLGVDDPADAIHVGDLRRTDVAGARGFGMTAVRYRGVADDAATHDDIADGHHVIDDLAELLPLVL